MSAHVEWASAAHVGASVTIADNLPGNEALAGDRPLLVLDLGGSLAAFEGSPAEWRALARRINNAITGWERAHEAPASASRDEPTNHGYCLDCGAGTVRPAGSRQVVIRHSPLCPNGRDT